MGFLMALSASAMVHSLYLGSETGFFYCSLEWIFSIFGLKTLFRLMEYQD